MVALKVGPVVLLVVKAESFYDRLKPYLKEHPDFHAAFSSVKMVVRTYRDSLISLVSISAIFDLTQFIILSYFPRPPL